MPNAFIEKIVTRLSSNENFQAFQKDIEGAIAQLRELKQQLDLRFRSEKERASSEITRRYNELVKQVNQAQAQLQKELDKVLRQIEGKASKLEEHLAIYRKMAIKSKKDLENILRTKKSTKAKTTKKTTTRKKTTRKRR
ncbi:MAG: hypothetical protein N2578_07955 [Bdellovibrionaceae bacterium]|nr:hypothetical protein [Pseudobdellovibrionaceae bacterium]